MNWRRLERWAVSTTSPVNAYGCGYEYWTWLGRESWWRWARRTLSRVARPMIPEAWEEAAIAAAEVDDPHDFMPDVPPLTYAWLLSMAFEGSVYRFNERLPPLAIHTRCGWVLRLEP